MFDNKEDLENHRKSSQNHWICEMCGSDFAYEHDLQEHYYEYPNHNYCTSCSRDFISPNNLSQVRQSSYPEVSRPMFINSFLVDFSIISPTFLGISLVSCVEIIVYSQPGRQCLSTWKTAAAPLSTS